MLPEVIHLTILWSHIEKSGQRMATLEIVQNAGLGRSRSRAVDRLNSNACSAESRNLIIHQCQQWRYDDCDAKVHDGW